MTTRKYTKIEILLYKLLRFKAYEIIDNDIFSLQEFHIFLMLNENNILECSSKSKNLSELYIIQLNKEFNDIDCLIKKLGFNVHELGFSLTVFYSSDIAKYKSSKRNDSNKITNIPLTEFLIEYNKFESNTIEMFIRDHLT